MDKSKEHLRIEIQLTRLIDKLPAEKLERALIALNYMATSSLEDGKALAEYSGRDDVTLDMIVTWVREKQKAVAV